jgi:hypothetical protein
MMTQPYTCPGCRNKMRFHVIDQQPMSVKLHPQTGEFVDYLQPGDIMAQPYQGVNRRVECALCGMNEGEQLFIKAAQRM